MRIVLLSGKGTHYATRRLRQAAKARGHLARALNPVKFVCRLEDGLATVYYYGRRFRAADVLIPRISVQTTEFGVAVVRQFELAGFPLVNHHQAIALSRNKMRCLQQLAVSGVPVPRTFTTRSSLSLDEAIRYLGGWPVVAKVLCGTQGVGVVLVDRRETLESLLQTIWSYKDNVLLQEYVRESKGEDIRVLVVGGRAVAAMRRTSRQGDFRSNIHRGGEALPVDLTQEMEDLAVRAAGAVGLDVAGVDLLESERGLLVNEVNSSPGLEGIEGATGIDAAGEIIAFAEAVAQRHRDEPSRTETSK